MPVRTLSIVPKGSLSKPGALPLLTLPSPVDFPPNLYNIFYESFIFILCNSLLVPWLWLNFASATKTPFSSCYKFQTWLPVPVSAEFSLLYCYNPHPRHHHYLPEMIQWSINQVSAPTSTSVSSIFSIAARMILINQSQIMSLCYYFRPGTISLYLWLSNAFHWNLEDSQ